MTRALLRCDASSAKGQGHLVRSLAIAAALRSRGADVSFAMQEDSAAKARVRREGYRVEEPRGEALGVWLARLAADVDLVVHDARDASSDDLNEVRKHATLAVIDDPGDRRLAADLVFYPPIPQVQAWSWKGFSGKKYVGWEWVALRPDVAGTSAARGGSGLLVTCGGSDPAGVTLIALDVWEGLRDPPPATFVLGPAFLHNAQLARRPSRAPHPTFARAPPDLPALMAEHDAALVSFGVTAYELAALGVPALHVPLSPDHAASSSAFVAAGMARAVPFERRNDPAHLRDLLGAFWSDGNARAEMAQRGRSLVDGRGADRIAATLLQEVT